MTVTLNAGADIDWNVTNGFNGRTLIFLGGGDGILYAFEPPLVDDTSAVKKLKKVSASPVAVGFGVATPEVRVWTNVGEAHIGYFGSSDAIADAKAEVLEG